MRSGDGRKTDSEYVMNGICSILVFAETVAGRYYVSFYESCTAVDWTMEIRYLSDEMHLDTKKVTLVISICCFIIHVADLLIFNNTLH